jgi:hypothetical protein
LAQCTVEVSYTASSGAAQLRDGRGQLLPAGASGKANVTVLAGANSIALEVDGAIVATTPIQGNCAASTLPDAGVCVSAVQATLRVSPPLLYGDRAALSWGHTGGPPSGCTPSANWAPQDPPGFGLSTQPIHDRTEFSYSCTNIHGTTTATVEITPCAFGQEITGATIGIGRCEWVQGFSHANATYAIMGPGGYPYRLSPTQIAPVPMRTRAGPDALQLTGCGFTTYRTPLTPVLLNCESTPGGARRIYFTNPNNEGLVEYEGALPNDIVWLFGAEPPAGGLEVRSFEGTYFTPPGQPLAIDYRADATGQSTRIHAGAQGNGARLLMTFTSPLSPL